MGDLEVTVAKLEERVEKVKGEHDRTLDWVKGINSRIGLMENSMNVKLEKMGENITSLRVSVAGWGAGGGAAGAAIIAAVLEFLKN